MYECQKHSGDDNSTVRVAIRIRPQNAKELIDLCRICTVVRDKDHQIILGRDKAFTFDYVFDMQTHQDAVYNTCISSLVEGCFEGYNATVFAYGQTGSGKTYTMGTGLDTSIATIVDEIGIVPRAVDHLFRGIEKRRILAFEKQEPAPDFKVTAQFMELYNEEIIDLLDTLKDPQLKGRKSHKRIHEDASGDIFVVGVTIRPVLTIDDTLQCLKSGVLSRATATTNMNISSSRSHAIFTLHIRQHRMVKDEISLAGGGETDCDQTEFETLTAKFHFVDLAGSERLKRTGATGDRAKEGISINCGLLALGNVISALGDNTKRGSHVPYRDSKLTRLLQDSLGGNSRTLMVACISPSDRDFIETVNTLKYANRARNIKNKVIANQDKASKQMTLLRAEILLLQQELLEFKMGKRTIDAIGLESLSDMVVENSLLHLENETLQHRIRALQDTVETVKTRNTQLLSDVALFSLVGSDGQATKSNVSNLIRKYIQDIEDLKTKLIESESLLEHLSKSSLWSSKSSSSRMSQSSTSVSSFASSHPDHLEISVLHETRKEKRQLKKLQNLNSNIVNKRIELDKLNPRCDEHITNQDKFIAERNGDDVNEVNDTNIEDNSEPGTSLESADRDSDNIHGDLANLACEITIKQRLIKELEKIQKKMNVLKAYYENRVQQLQDKIRTTEMERDIVMCDIEKMSTSSVDTIKKVQLEFEKKLNSLQDELKMTEQRKHARIQKNSSQYDQHLQTLQLELTEMKQCKMRLLKQVKQEVDKNKQNENRNSKELSHLRKENLRMDNIIKNLKRQTTQKDVVLKQKQEEVEALKQRQKPMSAKPSGRAGKCVSSLSSLRRSELSSKMSRHKWDSIEKNIASVISKHHTITMLERDKNAWLEQCDKCTKERDKYQQRNQGAVHFGQTEEVVHRMNNTVEDLSMKVEHAQEKIFECQSSIMQMEESKKNGDARIEISCLIETMTLEELKYTIQKLYHKSLDKEQSIAHKESEMQKMLDKLHQTELNNSLQQDLLHHMIDGHVSLEADDLMTHKDLIDVVLTSRSSSYFTDGDRRLAGKSHLCTQLQLTMANHLSVYA